MAQSDSRPDATPLWMQLGDDAADPSPVLREELRSHGAIVDVGGEVEWFGQWLTGDSTSEDALVFTTNETVAENDLASALSNNEQALSAARQSIAHLTVSANEWVGWHMAKFLYSVARDEMRFLQLDPVRVDHKVLHSHLKEKALGDQVRMLRVAELKLVLNTGVGTVYVLYEKEGEGRPEHMISETITPMEDERLRHYDDYACIPSRYQRPNPEYKYVSDWQQCENKRRSFHAMARGLHEEVIRPLAASIEGMINEDTGPLPTEPESCLLRILLDRADPTDCRPQWPKNGGLTSGSLPGMVSSYYMSTWEIRFDESRIEEDDISGDARRLARALCEPSLEIRNRWSTGDRKVTFFVWKETADDVGGKQLALSAHPDDYTDLVRVWSVQATRQGEPTGVAVRHHEKYRNRSSKIKPRDHENLEKLLREERDEVEVPFPGRFKDAFARANRRPSDESSNDGDSEPGNDGDRIKAYCDEVRDAIACPHHVGDIPAGTDCTEKRARIASRRIGPTPKRRQDAIVRLREESDFPDGQEPSDEEIKAEMESFRKVSICRKRFWSGAADDGIEDGDWQDTAIELWNKIISPVFNEHDDWLNQRTQLLGEGMRKPSDTYEAISKSMAEGTIGQRIQLEPGVEVNLPRLRITVEDGSLVAESLGEWPWCPGVGMPFGERWWPGIHIYTNVAIMIDTLDSLSGKIEHIVLRDDKAGLYGRRRAICIVSVKEWLGVLTELQRLGRSRDEKKVEKKEEPDRFDEFPEWYSTPP